MYVRSYRRRSFRARSSRSSSQWLWLDASLTAAAIGPGATAATVVQLDGGIVSQYGLTKTGAVIERIVGDVIAIPTIVPGGTSQDALRFNIGFTNAATPAANLDPTQGQGISLRWLHTETFFQPLSAAAVTTQAVVPAHRHIDIRVKRKYRDVEDGLFVAYNHFAGAGNTQVWNVQWAFRILVKMP